MENSLKKVDEFMHISRRMRAIALQSAVGVMVLGWILFSHLGKGHGWTEAWAAVGFVIGLCGCVLLHEFGHALTAKRDGIRAQDITLLPIGGIARLERLPENPRQELWVTLA